MPVPGIPELIVILVIVIVVFGAGRLSELGGAMGKSIKEFRKATADETVPAPEPVVAAPAPPVAVVAAPPAAPVLVENKCPSCATVNPISQVFCGQCGTRLTRAA
jgi:sec-independent protein translocase protein TatA